MDSLTSLPGPLLFGGALLVSMLVAMVTHAALSRLVRMDQREGSGITAAAYMTALGSLFAILTGFLIDTEYQTLRDTQNLVGVEVAAASQLAYSTEGLPAPDIRIVESKLIEYLDALNRDEWYALSTSQAERSSAFDALKDLQKVVFELAARDYAAPSSVNGMENAVGDLTQTRSERVSIASQGLPVALFSLSVAAGVFLIVNALVVSFRSGAAYSLVAVGIMIAVPLDLAAILAISAPFRGDFQASREPVQQLQAEMEDGRYLSWVQQRDINVAELDEGDPCGDPYGCVELHVGEPIELGALLWLDQDSCCIGLDSQVSVRLAIDYLDGSFDGKDGQLLGHDVVLLSEDDGCNAESGAEGAQRLADAPDLLAVVGTTCSSAALNAADEVLNEHGIVLMSPSNTAPSLTDSGEHERFYFRTAYNDKIQGAVIADFAYQSLQSASAVTISDRSTYSDDLSQVFSQRFRQLGGVVLSEETALPSESLQPMLDGLEASQPEAIFLALIQPQCAEVVKAIRGVAALDESKIIVSDACLESAFLATAGDAAQGVYGSGPDLDAIAADQFYTMSFLPAYERRYGQAPQAVYHTYAFDAANLIFDAVRRAAEPLPGGGLRIRRSDIRTALLSIDGYPGLSGPLTCRPSGDCAEGARIAIYEAPAWPVLGGVEDAKPVFSQSLTLLEVESAQ